MEYLVSISLGKSRERRETTYIGAVIPVHDLSWRPWKLSAAFLLTNSCCKRLLGGYLVESSGINWLGWPTFEPSEFKIKLVRVGFNPKMIYWIYLGVPENFQLLFFLLTAVALKAFWLKIKRGKWDKKNFKKFVWNETKQIQDLVFLVCQTLLLECHL